MSNPTVPRRQSPEPNRRLNCRSGTTNPERQLYRREIVESLGSGRPQAATQIYTL